MHPGRCRADLSVGHPVPLKAQSLHTILSRVAAELRVLQDEGRGLENAIGNALLGAETAMPDSLSNLQSIDLIVQSLGEIGAFVDRIGAMVEPDQLLDISAPIACMTLRDLARNLSGGARQPILGQSGEVSGEVDLF